MTPQPPPLAEFDGHRIRWDDWEVSPEIVHLRQYGIPECDQCGHDGQPWMTIGAILPVPGETFPIPYDKRLPSGRDYSRERQVRAWPYMRLYATRCPECGADEIHDMGRDGKQWVTLVG
jgi:hypothetical protein